jgi:hypothetical protein
MPTFGGLMPVRKLGIFLSYASEDQQFADVIADRLLSSFSFSVDLKYMSQFQLGMNFRKLIDQALDSADILLVIATGREKLSHGFTGYEVGYFRKSQETRRYIDENLALERLIIPIAMFAEMPDTLAEIEGVGIAKADRFLLDSDIATKGSETATDPFFNLLMRLDGILDRLDPAPRSPDQHAKFRSRYEHESQAFYRALRTVLSTLPLSVEFPKTRLSLRLPADFNSTDVELDKNVTVSCNGPTAGIFERTQSERWVPWPEFYRRIGPEEIAMTWNDALRALVASMITANFSNSDQLVFSFDERKLFRLFVSKSTTYFDETRELVIYVVEVFRYRDAGDPFTTFLAKAIMIALRYRSLFLEAGSPYGPTAIRLHTGQQRKAAVKELLRELRLLLLQSREAGLGEKSHILELYGAEESVVDGVLETMKTWQDQKEKLHASAAAVLAESVPSDATFAVFSTALSEFCARTRSINVTYTTTALRRLTEALKEG